MKTLLAAFSLCLASSCFAQIRTPVPAAAPPVIDPAAGTKALESLRLSKPDGDYALRFTLLHTPGSNSKLAETGYDGELYGTWRGDGPRVLVRLHPAGGGPVLVSLLTQGGSQPSTWIWKSGTPGIAGTPVEWTHLLDPLAPSLQFSAFDLQSPFLFWADYEYEGKFLEGRHEHRFKMKPPAAFTAAHPTVDSVRIYVDDEAQSAFKWEVIGYPAGTTKNKIVLRSSEINLLKKVEGRYMVKQVDFRDLLTRDKTRLQATAAAMGLALPQATFEPERLGDTTQPVEPERLKGI